MKIFTLPRRWLHVSCAALPLICVGATASAVHAQAKAGAGLVIAVDAGTSTLSLETRSGVQRVPVAAAATIRGDHGEVLTLGDLKAGDAVSYRTGSDTAISLHVARHFWSLPSER